MMDEAESFGDPAEVLAMLPSAKALGALRMEAIQAFLSLPRVGIGIGGLLLGVPGPKPQIRETAEIPCSHARGPAFLLTPEEIDSAAELKAAFGPRVLGMYVSRTRGKAEPASPDVVLFDAICPETGQMLLVIRPSTVEPVRAAVFIRQHDNSVRLECEWQLKPPTPEELAYEPEPEPPIEIKPVTAVKAAAAAAMENAAPDPPVPETPAPATRERQTAQALLAEAWKPEPAPAPAAPAHPELFRQISRNRLDGIRGKLAWAGGIVLLIVIALAGATRARWSPQPAALALDVADDHGAIVFHWNRDALDGADHGTLLVNDAGELSVFPLNGDGLASGTFRYTRKSDRIVAKLAVGDREARAVFFGK